MSEVASGGAAQATPWRWIALTAALASLAVEVVPGRSLSPMGVGLVLTASLHGPLAGGAAGIAAGLGRALATGQAAFVPALPLSGIAIGWAASRLPLPLVGITVLWVLLSSAPMMGLSSILAGGSDVAGLTSAARSLLDSLACGLVADLVAPHLRGAWGPAPGRHPPRLRRATYLALLLTSAMLAGAITLLLREHERIQQLAQRDVMERIRAYVHSSALESQAWLDQGGRVAAGLARTRPVDLGGFAEGARAATPDLAGLTLELDGAPTRRWSPGGCALPEAAADLARASRREGCHARLVARQVPFDGGRATAWLDLDALPRRIPVWTWVRELDAGRAWLEDEGGQVLVRTGGGDVWLPLPASWVREQVQPGLFRWRAPRSLGAPGPSWEARMPLASSTWTAWVLVPPGKRQAELEHDALRGLGLCLGLGLLGLLGLPALFLPLVPERDAPLVVAEELAAAAASDPPAPASPPSETPWRDLVADAAAAGARVAGVEAGRIQVELPPEGIPGAPAPSRALGRSFHLLLDEALAGSAGPWTIRLEACDGGRGVCLTLLDPRPPPDAVELAALTRPVERAGAHQALALAQRLATQAGVQLRVDGAPGGRRTRWVLGEAPPSDPPPSPREARPARVRLPTRTTPVTPVGPQRILLAEDNEANQLLIQALLASRGWCCDLVPDAHQAIAAAESGEYGLVLMDLHMPDLDGMEATREIRRGEEAEGRPRVPVVAITADLVEGTRERCLSAGMDDFLPKPVELDELAAVVERYVGRPGGG